MSQVYIGNRLIKNLDANISAQPPIIGSNGNWFLWSLDKEDYVDSGYPSRGLPGKQGDQGNPGSNFTVIDFYTDLSTLQSAVINPNVGDAYGIGSSAPYDIYIYSKTNGWVNNGSLQGINGDTPVRGTDYWTEADKTEIVNDVLEALPVAEGASF